MWETKESERKLSLIRNTKNETNKNNVERIYDFGPLGLQGIHVAQL